MNCFWFSFFNQLKDCGRNATLFLVTLAGLLVGLIIAALAVDNGHADAVIAVLIAVLLFFAIFLGTAIRRALRDRRHHLKFPGLSEDEVKKARAKLARRANLTRTLPVSPAKLRARPPVGEVY